MTRFLRSRPYAFALAVFVALLIANIVAQPRFASPSNWAETLAIFAPFAIAALASTPAIMSGGGGIDISIGPLMTVIDMVIVADLLPHGLGSVWIVVPFCLVAGATVGALNGTLVTVLRFQPVVATLCMNFILTGLATQIEGATTPQGSTWWTNDLANSFGPIPGGLISIGFVLLVWLALSRTAYLRNLYATGGDDATAFSAGVDVTRVRVYAYATGGLFAGVGGLALMAVLREGEAGDATMYTLVALAAVALGGTAFTGKRGSLIGSLFGAGCMYLITNVLSAARVPDTWTDAIYGALLIIAVIFGAGLASATQARTA
ncbi:ABC transporter permease [Trebonia sp.]|uniref:ABC transporter permease n=1 Tax=Trebonia sp. TaxID=2767075 RepID=UPI002619508A|nr:ABC transporter permease [Trebonia sp.]